MYVIRDDVSKNELKRFLMRRLFLDTFGFQSIKQWPTCGVASAVDLFFNSFYVFAKAVNIFETVHGFMQKH